MIKTIVTTGDTTRIMFGEFYKFFWVKNKGATTVNVSACATIAVNGDGTAEIAAGEMVMVENHDDCAVYVLGAGTVEIHAQNYIECPFEFAPVAGGGGEIVVDNIVSSTSTNPVQNRAVYAAFTEKVSNPNQLINPDFAINQRAVSGEFSEAGKYFVDRWMLVSGTVTVNSDKTLTLNGTICQILEKAVGGNFTAHANAGEASYDDTTKTFTLSASGEVIEWVKLEYGNIPTQFVPPDPVTELVKCQRYFRYLNRGTMGHAVDENTLAITAAFEISMRCTPTASVDKAVTLKNILTNNYITPPEPEDISISYANVSSEGVTLILVKGYPLTINGTFVGDGAPISTALNQFIALDAELY